jgi:hypothetical protein
MTSQVVDQSSHLLLDPQLLHQLLLLDLHVREVAHHVEVIQVVQETIRLLLLHLLQQEHRLHQLLLEQ